MADIRFDCPACAQPMIADEGGAGASIPCPQCAQLIQIPLRGIPVQERPELENEIAALKNQREKLTSALEIAQTQLNHFVIEARHASERLGNWEKQRDALHTALGQAKQELDKTREQLDAALAEREKLSGAVGVVAELNKEKAKLQEAEAHLKTACAQNEKLASDLRQTTNEREQARAQLGKSQNECEAFKSELSQIKAQLVETQSRADSVQSAHDKLKSELDQTQTDFAETNKRLSSANSEREKLADELTQTKTVLAETQQRAETVVAERNKLDGELKKTRAELAETQQGLQTADARRIKTTVELTQARAEISNQAKMFSALEKKHESLSVRFKRTKDELAKAFKIQSDDPHLSEQDAAPESGEKSLQYQNDFLSSIIASMNEERSRHGKELKEAHARMNLMMRGVMLFVVFILLVSFYIAWVGSKSLTML